MPYEIILDEDDKPILKLALENGSAVRLPFGDVAEDARNSLGEIIESKFNRVIREATLNERNRIQPMPQVWRVLEIPHRGLQGRRSHRR